MVSSVVRELSSVLDDNDPETFSGFHFIYLFIYLFSCGGEWGLLFVAVHGLLIAMASLVAEHQL